MTGPARRGWSPYRGHRSLPHTADLTIESWGRTREECLEQAVSALVEGFAEVSAAESERAVRSHLRQAPDADLVAAAVEEVIYRLDTEGAIPVRTEARRSVRGGIDLTMWLVSVDAAAITGSAPKAASLSGLRCIREESGTWRATVTVDV